jgi:hypothetical protein
MRKRTAVFAATAMIGLAAMACGGPARAQVSKPSLDAILQGGAAGANDLRKIEESLSSPDPDTRIATLNAILASGEPSYIAKAMEVSLLSDDPRLREAALRGKFEAGGNYRVEVDLSASSKETTDAAGWLRQNGGSISTDGASGLMNVPLGEYYEASHCWRHLNWNSCAFSLAGEQVFFSSRSYAEGQLRLDETGTLVGSLLVGGKGTPVPLRIPLVE